MAGAIAVAKRTHRPALPFERFSELLERIDSFKGRKLTKLAVKLTLLIFIRSSELRFARWSEIDFENAMWTIPQNENHYRSETFAPWFENANSTPCSFELSGIGCVDGN
jgi:integrase